jgi:ABC-type transporter Mla maintaining outer membrane lipid asymmetry ATPase subunit MlaF
MCVNCVFMLVHIYIYIYIYICTSGKSVLTKIIIGLMSPDLGTVEILQAIIKS